jgi:polygalacturonase
MALNSLPTCATLIVLLLLHGTANAIVFDIRSYGAIGDGAHMNTKAIAATIEAAAAAIPKNPRFPADQNTILITNGTYLSGQVVLLGGLSLQVTPSAILLASANYTDYPTDQSLWSFIFTGSQEYVTITGGGVIDGQQSAYIAGWDNENDEFLVQGWPNCTGECRPRLADLRNSTSLLVDNITFQNSPDWTFHVENCTQVVIRNLQQYGDHRWPNNDGIDIDSSQDVLLEDSSFNTGDDGICIKSTAGMQPVANVIVKNCTVRSRSCAIKFGSATPVDMYNLTFVNINIWDSNRGLGIQQRDPGNIWDVTFENITLETRFEPPNWWGSAEPIYISTIPRFPNQTAGLSHNITFRNIVARSENSAFISGRDGQPPSNVVLQNVSIVIDKWSNYTAPYHDYRPTTTVPDRVLAPVNGLYVEWANNITLTDVSLAFTLVDKQPYWSSECINATFAQQPLIQTNVTCHL